MFCKRSKMWQLAALLPCLLFVSEVSGKCDILLECGRLVGAEYLFFDETYILSYLKGNSLESVCPRVPNFTHCVDKNLASCDVQIIKVYNEANSNLLQYLCSPKGRELASSLANSDLTDNLNFRVYLKREIRRCYQTYKTAVGIDEQSPVIKGTTDVTLSDKCFFVKNLGQCLINIARDDSMLDLFRFIKDVWFYAAGKIFESFDCATEALPSPIVGGKPETRNTDKEWNSAEMVEETFRKRLSG
ncbi:hypothetical protein PoB_006459900 [Plakobranchus ocellatus]|uniref:Uncharacterized protein n=1 Tax=Plakobranchus ocellatus TaxID=259542 RepID=A0AAV4D1J3_9GAST|nr:hypothetical protein PoB_006459900 [Plakobranchus ocellatus]